MNYFLGIDGGGTKTKCVLIDDNLNVLFEMEGAASNPLSVGVVKSSSVISSLIKEIYQSFHLTKVSSIVIALAGAGRRSKADEVKREILDQLSTTEVDFDYFEVLSDAEATLEGALNGKPGAILISGTGSIVYGKGKDGIVQRAGGYGKIIGDEGSGYSIGRKGLNAVAHEFDAEQKLTSLTALLKVEFDIVNRDDLISKVYSPNFDVASIARLVIKCADEGDRVCIKIIKEEIDQLLLQVKFLKNKITGGKLNLCLSGGLAGTNNYFSNELKKKISSSFPDVNIRKKKYPAEIGAALLAIKFKNKK